MQNYIPTPDGELLPLAVRLWPVYMGMCFTAILITILIIITLCRRYREQNVTSGAYVFAS